MKRRITRPEGMIMVRSRSEIDADLDSAYDELVEIAKSSGKPQVEAGLHAQVIGGDAAAMRRIAPPKNTIDDDTARRIVIAMLRKDMAHVDDVIRSEIKTWKQMKLMQLCVVIFAVVIVIYLAVRFMFGWDVTDLIATGGLIFTGGAGAFVGKSKTDAKEAVDDASEERRKLEKRIADLAGI